MQPETGRPYRLSPPLKNATPSLEETCSAIRGAIVRILTRLLQERIWVQVRIAPPIPRIKAAKKIHLAAFFIGESIAYCVVMYRVDY